MTKSGEIAGPRILEHIVDTVLYMEVGILTHLISTYGFLSFNGLGH